MEDNKIKVGRKIKYSTLEELSEANRIKAKRYYEKNKESIKAKNLATYYKNKKKK